MYMLDIMQLFIYLFDWQGYTRKYPQCVHEMEFILFLLSHVRITYAVRQIPRKINYFLFPIVPQQSCRILYRHEHPFIYLFLLLAHDRSPLVCSHARISKIIYLFICLQYFRLGSVDHASILGGIIYLFIYPRTNYCAGCWQQLLF